MRGLTISTSVDLVTEECYSCHVLFAFTQDLKNDLLKERSTRSFYCPNGHAQHYAGESEEQRLKRELDTAQRKLEYARADRDRLANDNMDLAKSNRSLKASKTKLLRRVTNGVCTYCHRSFANVTGHMQSKHPDQVVTAEQTEPALDSRKDGG